ncbi:MAG: S-methyl-5-thioribose-1-phosphate isomerase [Sedimentisphaerales bacterium]|jgi:methylthioribose-1-phosphate isomerase
MITRFAIADCRFLMMSETMIIRTLKWVGGVDGYLEIIDQRVLPGEYKTLRCSTVKQLYDAIKTLAVRGAPAIGVAGGYGAVLSLQGISKNSAFSAVKFLKRDCEYLASSRPTAVNLRWAIERIVKCAENSAARLRCDSPRQAGTICELRKVVLKEANDICREDIEMCHKIGANGARFIKNGVGVLTHCNAGALATAGQGTALSVLYEAKKRGKKFRVFVDETRPLLQGARLTAWELKRAKIDTTVICDNMAAALMRDGKIDLVITGADRIAGNGDAANKTGTYGLSVLAKAHKIPFYIAAPSSTFDLKTKTGKDIPIEQRPADEIRFCGDKKVTPNGVDIYNPAFDVTPAENITAIITERGVIKAPNANKIAKHLVSSG